MSNFCNIFLTLLLFALPLSASSGYLSYKELKQKLASIESIGGGTVLISSIGKSTNGKDLLAARITSGAGNKREVKIVGTTHGDEILGQEVIVRLAEYLTINKLDTRVRSILERIDLWLIPNLNPDGTELRQRENSRNADLNRDFPDPSAGQPNTQEGREKETQAMMAFSDKHNFVRSITFHGGALVVNYPWDSSPDPTPENTYIKSIALAYAKNNVPMFMSTEFKDGITYGYSWYPIYGGMSDWNYAYKHCIELTVEIYDTKWPNYSVVEKIWKDNLESLLVFLENA